MSEQLEQGLFFSVDRDPYNHIIHVMCNRWKPFIIRAIDFEKENFTRFNTFTKQLPITERVLARNLRELEEDNIISRKVYPEVPLRVEYRLTELGKSLCPILDAMYNWGWNDMKRKGLPIDPLGEMWHGYRERDEELMHNAYKK